MSFISDAKGRYSDVIDYIENQTGDSQLDARKLKHFDLAIANNTPNTDQVPRDSTPSGVIYGMSEDQTLNLDDALVSVSTTISGINIFSWGTDLKEGQYLVNFKYSSPSNVDQIYLIFSNSNVAPREFTLDSVAYFGIPSGITYGEYSILLDIKKKQDGDFVFIFTQLSEYLFSDTTNTFQNNGRLQDRSSLQPQGVAYRSVNINDPNSAIFMSFEPQKGTTIGETMRVWDSEVRKI